LVVRPVTVQVVVGAVAVQVLPPGLAVAVYEVIAEPPVLAGAAQLTATDVEVVVPTAVADVGTPGTPAVTAVEADEAVPVPSALVAVTVKV